MTAKQATPKKRNRVPQQITETQRLVLAGLHRLTKKHGEAPTQQELADHLGYADHVGVIRPLRALERLGLIVPIERVVHRGHRLTPAGLEQLP